MITLPTAAGKTTEYEDFYETTLAAPCTLSDTDIYPTVLPSSAVGFLVIDPLGTNPEIIFFNFKGANFVRVPSAVDGEGRGVGNTTPRAFDQGTKVGMYSIAEFYEGIVTGKFMRDGFLESRHFSSAIDPNSWIGTGETWNYVGNNGQKEYQYVVAGDKTTKYTKGMKLRMPRVIAAPTMSADLESTSSQYASRAHASVTGLTATDDITVEAWIKLESYTSGTIMARTDVGLANGFFFGVTSEGRLFLRAYNAGNANMSQTVAIPGVPIGRWVHVAAVLDMSAFTTSASPIYINGVLVPVVIFRSGTNPTSFVQTGDLAIGRTGALASEYFDGGIQEARYWNAARSQAQVRDNMHKQLVGNEVGLGAYFKLDGNFNDSTANGNHLTGGGGAVATTVENNFKAVEYGIITDLSFSAGNTTITVFTGTDHNAPYENLSGIGYSAARNPVGFPAARGKWRVEMLTRVSHGNGLSSAGVWVNPAGLNLVVPTGEWELGYECAFGGWRGANVNTSDLKITLSTTNNSETDLEMSAFVNIEGASSTIAVRAPVYKRRPRTMTAPTTHYLNLRPGATIDDIGTYGTLQPTIVFAESPYV